MKYILPALLASSLFAVWSTPAQAVASAELVRNQAYLYGRFEARLRFAPGDGVVSSFFLWKSGSEKTGTFWNELDFEKLGADCHLQTNSLYGDPTDTGRTETVSGDLCAEYHTYAFEWTPDAIAFLVDGVELRRDTGKIAAAFAENAQAGMQFHFNVWPGDETFGGNFDPSILPVQEFISWVQYSSYADGQFTFKWREDFDGGKLPSGWSTGNWESPKSNSTHKPANVTYSSGIAVLSLTADGATGFKDTPPSDSNDGTGGSSGNATGGASSAGGASSTGGKSATKTTSTGGSSGAETTGTGGSSDADSSTGGTSAAVTNSSAAKSNDDSGCSVRGLGRSGAKGAIWAVLGLTLVAALRRRRARHSA